jgi:hypothetical protein
MLVKKTTKQVKKQGKYKITLVPLRNSEIKVYASPKISSALAEVAQDMNLYQGVRLAEILEAVYEQGKKDGARAAFAAVESQVVEARRLVPHRLPGRPRKKS